MALGKVAEYKIRNIIETITDEKSRKRALQEHDAFQEALTQQDRKRQEQSFANLARTLGEALGKEIDIAPMVKSSLVDAMDDLAKIVKESIADAVSDGIKIGFNDAGDVSHKGPTKSVPQEKQKDYVVARTDYNAVKAKVDILESEKKKLIDERDYHKRYANEVEGWYADEVTEKNKLQEQNNRLQEQLNRISSGSTIGVAKDKGGIAIDKETLESVLKNIVYNVEVKSNKGGDAEKAPWALENTLKNNIGSILGEIRANTSRITTPADTVHWSALSSSIQGVVNLVSQINNKLVQGTKPIPLTTPNKSKLFDQKTQTEFASLSLLETRLGAGGKLTDEINQKITNITDSLIAVQDDEGLREWKQELSKVLKEIQEIVIANNLLETESEETFSKLINITKQYNKMIVNAENATMKAVKDFYTKEASSLLSQGSSLFSKLPLTDEQKDEIIALRQGGNKKVEEIRAHKKGSHDVQVEKETIRELIDLYKQLGEAQSKKDKQEISRLATAIGSKKSGLSSIDYKTKMEFRHSREKGSQEGNRDVENEIVKYNKDHKKSLDELENKYVELGELRAELEATPTGDYSERIKLHISELEELIEKEKERLALSKQEVGLLESKTDDAYNRSKSNYEDKAAKERDKARKHKSESVFEDGGKAAEEYKKIIDKTKEYTKWSIEAAKANKEGERTKYTEYANKAFEERNALLKQYVQTFGRANLSQKQQAELIELTLDRQKKLNEAQKRQVVKDFKTQVKEAQSDVTMKKTGASLRKSQNVAFDIMSDAGFDNFDANFKGKVREYKAEVDEFKKVYADAMREIENEGKLSESTEKKLISQMQLTDRYTAELEELVDVHKKLSGNNRSATADSKLGLDSPLEDYKSELEEFVKKITEGKATITGFDNATKTLQYTIKGNKRETIECSAAVDHLAGSYVALQNKSKRVEGWFDRLKRKTGEIATYFMSSISIYTVANKIKQGIQYVREIDTAMTELKKVTSETDEVYERFLNTAAKTGAKLGATISEVTDATATFSKLGYSMDLATEMAEAAIVYKNVGDNISSTEDAADSIISTLKGFGMQASESMEVVDRFNEIGNRFAITSQGIGEALRLSASALNEGGNSLDESIAMITAANEVVGFMPRSHSNMVTRSDLKRGNS